MLWVAGNVRFLKSRDMPFILDTCALSELVTKSPNPRAVQTMLTLPREELYLSVMTAAELKAGIEALPMGARKEFLQGWFEEHVLRLYRDRLLAVDMAVALRWGELKIDLRKRGRSMQVIDGVIAATALAHGFILVTRNEADFIHSGVRVLNPWK
jgi:predicted nucleic acid-binding protein